MQPSTTPVAIGEWVTFAPYPRTRMQRTTALALLAAMSTIAADAVAQRQGGRRNTDPSSIKLESLVFAEKTFHSDAVDADVQYGVYLPKDYQDEKNKDTKYPLVIWLHGMFEDHLRFHGRGGAPVLDAAVVDGKLPPCVFVCPNGGRTSMLELLTVTWPGYTTRSFIASLLVRTTLPSWEDRAGRVLATFRL